MRGHLDLSLDSRRTPEGGVLVDTACRSCHACAAGAALWCRGPLAPGRDISPELPADRLAAVAGALLAVSAAAAAPVAPTVLVLADPAGPTAVLARSLLSGRVLVAPDPSLVREQLSGEPTGRAAVVVVGDGDVRSAVRAVRRGGHVCVVDPVASPPSVTELVQREVTLVAAQDVVSLAARIDTDLWAAAVAAA